MDDGVKDDMARKGVSSEMKRDRGEWRRKTYWTDPKKSWKRGTEMTNSKQLE